MTGPELESRLRDLHGAVEWPPTPDLAAGVVAALPGRRRTLLGRRAVIAFAAALLVAAFAAVMAVPSTRSAVLRVFGVGAVEVRVVDELPPVPADAVELPLGDRISVSEARAALPGLLEPDESLGPPDAVHLLREPVTLVTFVWHGSGGEGVRLLAAQLGGRFTKATAGKIGTDVTFLAIDGDAAVWIGGGTHLLFLEAAVPGGYVETATVLARNTLVVDRGGVTLRIEGDITQARAVEIARRFR
jgi:hypothetical protein